MKELKDYVSSTFTSYRLLAATQSIFLNESILENTKEFVPCVLKDERIGGVFTKFKKISEKKEIYLMEPLLNLFADCIKSKVVTMQLIMGRPEVILSK